VTKTPDLIDALVECATPVRRLRPPLVRAALWLAFAGLVLALLAIGHGVRTDLVECLRQPVFVASIAAALATGVLAAVAAFVVSLPDRSQWWLLRPGAVTLAGALAVAAITSSALSLFHDLDATMMILIWNLGTAAVITGLGGVFGRRVLRRTESHLLAS
jgi:hypothetical protein